MTFPTDDSAGQSMKLVDLKIERHRWGANAGQYSGQITFESKAGIVGLNLNDEQCARMFAVVADGIVETAKAAAMELTREAMATIAKPALVIK